MKLQSEIKDYVIQNNGRSQIISICFGSARHIGLDDTYTTVGWVTGE